jgi:hypothetical protein
VLAVEDELVVALVRDEPEAAAARELGQRLDRRAAVDGAGGVSR